MRPERAALWLAVVLSFAVPRSGRAWMRSFPGFGDVGPTVADRHDNLFFALALGHGHPRAIVKMRSNGSMAWQRTFGRPEWVYDLAIAAGDRVVLAVKSGPTYSVLALDGRGHREWRTPTPGFGLLQSDAAGDILVGGSGASKLNGATGVELWHWSPDSTLPSPSEGWGLVTSAKGTVVAYAYRRDFGLTGYVVGIDGASGSERWRYPVGAVAVLGTTTSGDVALSALPAAGEGSIILVDAIEGTVRWSVPIPILLLPQLFFSGLLDDFRSFPDSAGHLIIDDHLGMWKISDDDGGTEWTRRFDDEIRVGAVSDTGDVFLVGSRSAANCGQDLWALK